MPIEGVDAYSRPDAARLAAAGRRFVARYLKNVTRAEIDADHAAGLTVVLVSETTGRRALEGAAAGAECAAADLAKLHALGAPKGIAVYWAEDDLDVTATEVAPVVAAARAYRAGLTGYRSGFYGGLRAVTAVGQAHAADYLWQTYGWSGGRWYPAVTLEQYLNGQQLGGVGVDLDRALTPAYGGWAPHTAPAVIPPPTTAPVPLPLSEDDMAPRIWQDPAGTYWSGEVIGGVPVVSHVPDTGSLNANFMLLGISFAGVVPFSEAQLAWLRPFYPAI